MTNVLPALGASCSPSLSPLDFSSLIHYSDSAPPSSRWSPLCAPAALHSPFASNPFLQSPLSSTALLSPPSSPSAALFCFPTRPFPTQQTFLPSSSGQELARCVFDQSFSSPAHPDIEPSAPSLMTDDLPSPHTTTTTTAAARRSQPSPALSDELSISTAPSEAPTAEDKASVPLKPSSSIDKAAERRRRNRESSSRCYYNRKRIIKNLETQLRAEKDKLTKLYHRALQLRNDNARLKKEVVTSGYSLPVSRTKRANQKTNNSFSLRDYLRLLHSSIYQNPAHVFV